jgi:hypothetical protein
MYLDILRKFRQDILAFSTRIKPPNHLKRNKTDNHSEGDSQRTARPKNSYITIILINVEFGAANAYVWIEIN